MSRHENDVKGDEELRRPRVHFSGGARAFRVHVLESRSLGSTSRGNICFRIILSHSQLQGSVAR